MDVKHRLTRSVGTAAVALFLVTGAAFGANALSQTPAGPTDPTLVASDESASPEAIESAEPSETPEPSETTEPSDTPEAADTPKAADTTEPVAANVNSG